MAIDFSKLRNKNSLKDIQEKASKESNKFTDENEGKMWKPTLDKAGNGSAEIRFLPPVADEESPWIKMYEHSFQGPTGKWYIEKSLTTISKEDPVSQYNTELWDTGIEEKQNQARKQKRKLSYFSNIYVVKDSANPDNEGKVFLYKFTKPVFDLICGAIEPKFADEEPFDPFNLWEGANLKFRIYTKEVMIGGRKVNVPQYDKCVWGKRGPLAEDDEMEKIWKQEHSLQELIAESKFKSYDDLKKRLESTLNLGQKSQPQKTKPLDEEDNNVPEEKQAPTPSSKFKVDDEDDTPKTESKKSFDSDNERLNYFASLAEEDDD